MIGKIATGEIEDIITEDGKNAAAVALKHDPEKWTPVFPRDKRGTRLRGDHAQTKRRLKLAGKTRRPYRGIARKPLDCLARSVRALFRVIG
jgi:hypothetical protein